MEQALTALATGGPVAVLAGLIVIVLWKKLNALQVYYQGDPDPAAQRPGLIANMQKAAQEREDGLRSHYEAQLAQERIEQRKVMDELLAALRGDLPPAGNPPPGADA